MTLENDYPSTFFPPYSRGQILFTSLIKNILKSRKIFQAFMKVTHTVNSAPCSLWWFYSFNQLNCERKCSSFFSTWNLQVQSKGSQTGAMRWKSLRISKLPEDPFCCLHPLKMFILPRFNIYQIDHFHFTFKFISPVSDSLRLLKWPTLNFMREELELKFIKIAQTKGSW